MRHNSSRLHTLSFFALKPVGILHDKDPRLLSFPSSKTSLTPHHPIRGLGSNRPTHSSPNSAFSSSTSARLKQEGLLLEFMLPLLEKLFARTSLMDDDWLLKQDWKEEVDVVDGERVCRG